MDTPDIPVTQPTPKAYTPTADALAKVENNFTYHSPLGDQPARYTSLRTMFRDLAYAVLATTPPSREQSLALTALEEASMWANASISRNEKG